MKSQYGNTKYEVRIDTRAYSEELLGELRDVVRCNCGGFKQCFKGRVCKHVGAVMIMGGPMFGKDL